MNRRNKTIIGRIITSIIILITYLYATILLCFAPVLFSVDVINNKIKLLGPKEEIISFMNQKFLSLLKFNLGTTYDNKQLAEIIWPYVFQSIGLLTIGVMLGLILGVLKGIVDSRRDNHENTMKILSSIIPLSLPDVLIIAFLQYGAIWLNKHGISIFKVAGTGDIKHIILPVIALALPCACYIARITAISVEDCYKSEYVKIALGKGCSTQRILWNHVMRNVIGIVLKGLSNISAMIICNMVIVEYMFSYPGLTMLLIKMQKNHDFSSFISVIVIIGIVYFALDALFRFIRMVASKSRMEELA